MLPVQARANLAAMAMKGCSAFPKAPALLEPHYQIGYPGYDTKHCGGGGQFYLSAEVQLVYSTAPADWATERVEVKTK